MSHSLSVKEHTSGCCLEMIPFLLLLYLLKALLNFDVFGQTVEGDEGDVNQKDNSEDNEEHYNEDTFEKSYEVSSWTGSESGDDDEEDTDITNVTDDSNEHQEEIIDEEAGNSDRSDDADQQNTSRSDSENVSESEGCSDIPVDTIYETDWYKLHINTKYYLGIVDDSKR